MPPNARERQAHCKDIYFSLASNYLRVYCEGGTERTLLLQC
jgi:hypothetical protein